VATGVLLLCKEPGRLDAGEREFVFHGGISRATGRRSSITARSIIAIKGKAMAMKGFNQVPPLKQPASCFAATAISARIAERFSFLRLTRDHIRRYRAAAPTRG